MWDIDFHEKAKPEFKELPRLIRKKFVHIFKIIELEGVSALSHKHHKYIEDGIWELRARSQDGIARSLYITETAQTLKILTAFIKKTQETPREKINLAKKRRSE